jgi:hypothetical protein
MRNETPEQRHARVIANRRHATNATSTPPASTTATLRTAASRTPHTRAAVEAAIRSLGRDPGSYRMDSASMLHVRAGGRVPGSDVDAIAEALGNPADAPAFGYRPATPVAAAQNDAAPPPPPDVATRIRQKGNYSGVRHAKAEATRVAGVRTLLRPNGPLPVRDEPGMALPDPLVTAANADQHAAPPPPDIRERILKNRGEK